MGIRFLCPNGHRLNVKAFLAGKRGVCPHCGEKFTVPSESTLPSTKDEEAKDEEVEHRIAMPPTALTDLVDPLAEAPDASWYVAPPDGDRLGPVDADTMRTWIAEGQVAGDALVWREGWADWRAASAVFPQLATDETPAVARVSPIVVGSEPHRPAVVSPVRRSRLDFDRRRREARKKSVRIVILLVVLVVVLAAVFLWVIRRS